MGRGRNPQPPHGFSATPMAFIGLTLGNHVRYASTSSRYIYKFVLLITEEFHTATNSQRRHREQPADRRAPVYFEINYCEWAAEVTMRWGRGRRGCVLKISGCPTCCGTLDVLSFGLLLTVRKLCCKV